MRRDAILHVWPALSINKALREISVFLHADQSVAREKIRHILQKSFYIIQTIAVIYVSLKQVYITELEFSANLEQKDYY